MTGTIRSLKHEKFFGFISTQGQGDVFFHRSALTNAQFEDLQPEQRVSFDVVETERGLRAENVRVQ